MSVAMLGYKAGQRRGYGPLSIGVLAVLAIIGGKFFLNVDLITYAGIIALIAASIWNAWPRKVKIGKSGVFLKPPETINKQ